MDSTLSPIPSGHFYGLSFVVPMSITIVIFIVLAVGGNVMVILTVARNRGMRTRTNMFIVNLAITNLCTAIFNMPVSLTTIISNKWILGDIMCQFNGFSMALFFICSIHTLMYISIHKFISFTKPFSRVMGPKKIMAMISASWMWSFVCAILPLVGVNKIVYKRGSSQCGPTYPDEPCDYILFGITITTNYLLPLGVITFCYFRIFREIREHLERIRETSNINLEYSDSQQKRISITLFLVFACFLLCWTPFVLYFFIGTLIEDKDKMPEIINPIVYWCGYFNSACNPIIYAFRSPSFRESYKEIMCCYKGQLTIGGSFHSLRSSSKSQNCVVGIAPNDLSNFAKKFPEINAELFSTKTRFLTQIPGISMPCLPNNIKLINTMASGTSSNEKDEMNLCILSLEGSEPCDFCAEIGRNPNKLLSIPGSRLAKSCPSLAEENDENIILDRKTSCVECITLRSNTKNQKSQLEEMESANYSYGQNMFNAFI